MFDRKFRSLERGLGGQVDPLTSSRREKPFVDGRTRGSLSTRSYVPGVGRGRGSRPVLREEGSVGRGRPREKPRVRGRPSVL